MLWKKIWFLLPHCFWYGKVTSFKVIVKMILYLSSNAFGFYIQHSWFFIIASIQLKIFDRSIQFRIIDYRFLDEKVSIHILTVYNRGSPSYLIWIFITLLVFFFLLKYSFFVENCKQKILLRLWMYFHKMYGNIFYLFLIIAPH